MFSSGANVTPEINPSAEFAVPDPMFTLALVLVITTRRLVDVAVTLGIAALFIAAITSDKFRSTSNVSDSVVACVAPAEIPTAFSTAL